MSEEPLELNYGPCDRCALESDRISFYPTIIDTKDMCIHKPSLYLCIECWNRATQRKNDMFTTKPDTQTKRFDHLMDCTKYLCCDIFSNEPTQRGEKVFTTKTVDEIEETIRERAKVYGPPVACMTDIGRMWGVLLSRHNETDVNVPPHMVALLMLALKAVRLSYPNGPDNKDTAVDLEAYSRLLRETLE